MRTNQEFDLLMCVLDAFEGHDPTECRETIDTILCNLIDADLVNCHAAPEVWQAWTMPGISTRANLKRLYVEKAMT